MAIELARMRDATIDYEAASRLLVEEAASPDKEAFVARRGGRRWVRRFERLELCATDASSLPLKQRGRLAGGASRARVNPVRRIQLDG